MTNILTFPAKGVPANSNAIETLTVPKEAIQGMYNLACDTYENLKTDMQSVLILKNALNIMLTKDLAQANLI